MECKDRELFYNNKGIFFWVVVACSTPSPLRRGGEGEGLNWLLIAGYTPSPLKGVSALNQTGATS